MRYLQNGFSDTVMKNKNSKNSGKISKKSKQIMTSDPCKDNGVKHIQTQDICNILF
jgi:hypothetical protein